ncbi:MAG: DUF2769 domain-containing protein [Methanomicrobiales archaeon]|nr:DUF2769 domain-containing protein [Methanomicrobiales archaeon]
MQVLDLSDQEKQTIIDKRTGQCICPQCPTYKECQAPAKEAVFCTIGKSGCITKEVKCICSTCPFAAEFGLKNMFYCTRGSEKQQLLLETMQVRSEWVR